MTEQKKSRGVGYLVVQAGLFALIAFGPHSSGWLPQWDIRPAWPGWLAAAILLIVGALLAVVGTFNLGRNLTPLPIPKAGSTLITTGAYRLVRHPIYSGLILISFGWGIWLNSWLNIGYALLLFGLFDSKSRYEERLLSEKFTEYAAYRQRVKKLIPFLY